MISNIYNSDIPIWKAGSRKGKTRKDIEQNNNKQLGKRNPKQKPKKKNTMAKSKGYKCKNCHKSHYNYRASVILDNSLEDMKALVICNECNALNGELKLGNPKLSGKCKVIKFGKYKGTQMKDMRDIHYLLWLVETQTNIYVRYGAFEQIHRLISSSFQLQKAITNFVNDVELDSDVYIDDDTESEKAPWE